MGFVYVFFSCCLANAILFYGGQSLLYIVFAVVGAKDKPLKRVFKNTLISLTAAHAIVLFLCMIGLLHDNIDVRWIGNQTGAFFQGEYVRHAFGFLNSNQIPLIYMLLLFMYVGIRGRTVYCCRNDCRSTDKLAYFFVLWFQNFFCASVCILGMFLDCQNLFIKSKVKI